MQDDQQHQIQGQGQGQQQNQQQAFQQQQQPSYNGRINFPEQYRVKVYRLNSEGQWDDKGTGYISLEMLKGGNWVSVLSRDQEEKEQALDQNAVPASNSTISSRNSLINEKLNPENNNQQKQQNGETISCKCLVVLSELDNRCLLIHRVQGLEIYQRQGGDTIITWADPQLGTDIAISFQEESGCNKIWESLQDARVKSSCEDNHLRAGGQNSPKMHQDYIQNRMGGSNNRHGVVDEYEAQIRLHDGDIPKGQGGLGHPQQPVDLPPPQMGNLKDFAGMLSEVSALQREQVAAQVLKQSYIPKLIQLFQQCEDLEDKENLKYLFFISKGLILLNDSGILEEMFREEHMMTVIGTLEYDPEISEHQNHRHFIQAQVKFKQVIPINDKQTLAKIHQTYHIGYIKDVILPRVLDDPTFATLHSLMLFNNIDVLNALQSQPDFIRQLFQQLKTKSVKAVPKEKIGDKDAAEETKDPWTDLLSLLHEICNLAKNFLQGNDKDNMFNGLLQEGLLDVTTELLLKGDIWARFKCANILQAILQYSPTILRDYLFQHDDVVAYIIQGLLQPSNDGLPEQMCDIIKGLMDSQTMEHNLDNNDFLTRFYEHHMMTILECMEKGATDPNFSPFTLGLLLDVLNLCIEKHTYQFKYFCLKKQAVDKVVALVQRKESWVVVAVVRCVRRMVGLKDDFYNRYLMRHDMFRPIVEVFLKNGDKYNLLNSTVLELFEYIKNENIKCLIEHLVDDFYSQLQDITYVETFQQMKQRHEQFHRKGDDSKSTDEIGGSNSSGISIYPFTNGGQSSKRRRRDQRSVDREEEDYFNSIEDDADDMQQSAKVKKRCIESRYQTHQVEQTNQKTDRSSNSLGDQGWVQEGEDVTVITGSKGEAVSPNLTPPGGAQAQGVWMGLPLVNYGDDEHDDYEDEDGDRDPGIQADQEKIQTQQECPNETGEIIGEMCNTS